MAARSLAVALMQPHENRLGYSDGLVTVLSIWLAGWPLYSLSVKGGDHGNPHYFQPRSFGRAFLFSCSGVTTPGEPQTGARGEAIAPHSTANESRQICFR
jgi:hypothetical protein